MKEMCGDVYGKALEYVQAGCLVFFPPYQGEYSFYWVALQVRDCPDLWHHEPWRRQAAVAYGSRSMRMIIEKAST